MNCVNVADKNLENFSSLRLAIFLPRLFSTLRFYGIYVNDSKLFNLGR